MSSGKLKSPLATNRFAPSFARQRSAACFAFAFTPAVTAICLFVSYGAGIGCPPVAPPAHRAISAPAGAPNCYCCCSCCC